MAVQIVKGLQAEIDLKKLNIGDIGMILDGFGDPTGQLRLGVGDQLGGFQVNGAVGSGSVVSVNGQTGVVSLGIEDMDDVDLTTPPVSGHLLGWDGSNWTARAFAGAVSTLADVTLTSLTDGQSLRWDNPAGRWVNYTPATGGGGSDNLGNHTATLDLNLANHAINNATALTLMNTWRVTDSAGGSLIFDKVGSPALTLLHTTTPGAGYLALPSYGIVRPDDSGTVSLTNLAYFGTNGILRKANRAANADAFKGIPADAFGLLSGLAAGTVDQVLAFNGTNYVPTTLIPGGGAAAFTDLTDVPDNYTGDGLKSLRVNVGEDAIEFFTPTAPTFATLTEIAAAAPHVADEVVFWNGSAWTVGTGRFRFPIQPGTPTTGQALVWGALGRFDFVTALVTDFTDPVAVGSLMYFDGTAWIDIPPGTNGDVLTMVLGIPAWA